MYMQYSCMDPGVSRDQLYRTGSEVVGKFMELLVRLVRKDRASQKQVTFLKQEVASLKEENAKLRLQLEVAEASASFTQDGKCLCFVWFVFCDMIAMIWLCNDITVLISVFFAWTAVKQGIMRY